MGIKLLYGFAAFLETGIGIWIFGQAFPKREKMEKRHRLSEWLVFFWITLCAYSFPNFYWGISDKEKYIGGLMAVHIAVAAAYVIYRMVRKQLGQMESGFIRCLLFTGMSLCVTCQFWDSYQSYNASLVGNLFPPFFLWAFYRCSFVQAYLWQFFFSTNLGMLKNIYITYAGIFENRRLEDFFYWPRSHTYPEVFYLLALCIGLILINRYMPLKKAVASVLEDHKRVLFSFTAAEWLILSIIVKFGIGKVETNNFAAALTITGIMASCMLVIYIRFVTKTNLAERKLLDMRNEIIERQYREMKKTYERYRCVVHDEKHMLMYLKECLENGDIPRAQKIVDSYQTNINEAGRCRWTGIQNMDFILSIKKQQMDDLFIKLEMECQAETIPMDDADFVVMFSNLLDNAIEAAQQCRTEKRKIKVILKNINSMFFLKVRNACKHQPKTKEQRFLTSKKDKERHGWGIESVKHIVEKYKGEISFCYSEEYFEVSVLINIEEK